MPPCEECNMLSIKYDKERLYRDTPQRMLKLYPNRSIHTIKKFHVANFIESL